MIHYSENNPNKNLHQGLQIYVKRGVLHAKIFQGVTLTPQIFGCKIVFSLPFSKQILSTLTANVVNLI